MGTAIATREHKVPKGSRLERSELELAEALASEFEAFYQQGVILERIRLDGEYEDAGYESFNQYMDERMPQGIKRRHAAQIVAASKIRPLVPDLGATRANWSEWTLRYLTHKDFNPSDVKRLGKKIATRVRKGEPLTASLVKSICDADRGVERKKKEKQAKALAVADTPAGVMRQLKVDVELWQSSLEEFPASFWTDAEAEDPDCVKRAISALSALVSYLRS